MKLDQVRWCSWCHNQTTHKLVKKKHLSRGHMEYKEKFDKILEKID